MGVQCSPKTLQDAQDGPKTAQEGPKTPRQDSKRTPEGLRGRGAEGGPKSDRSCSGPLELLERLRADRKMTEATRGHWNYWRR